MTTSSDGISRRTWTTVEPFNPEPWRLELLAFVRRMGATDGEDVVQEAFLRAVSRPPGSRPRAWLYRTVLHLLVDRERKARRSERVLPDLARSSQRADDDPSKQAEASDLVATAWLVIATLSLRKKAALYLRIQRQMDFDDIAGVLRCSIASARQHFHLAVKAVRNAIAEREDG